MEVKSTTGKPKREREKKKKHALQEWSQTSGGRESLFLTPSLLELDYVQKTRYWPDRHSKLGAQQDNKKERKKPKKKNQNRASEIPQRITK